MPGFPRGPIDPQVKATRGAVYLLVGERKVNTADLSPMIKESHATRDRIGIASSPGAEPYRYEILKEIRRGGGTLLFIITGTGHRPVATKVYGRQMQAVMFAYLVTRSRVDICPCPWCRP